MDIALWITAILMSFVLVGIMRSWNIIDTPNYRSAHRVPTPSSGGVGIATTTLVLGMLGLFINSALDSHTLIYLCSTGGLAVLGFFDDKHDLPARLRLIIQHILGSIAILALSSLELRSTEAISYIRPSFLFFGVLFSTIGVMNFYNFIDGIDGIAASQAIIASASWVFLLYGFEEKQVGMLAGIVLFSTLGFLIWNFPPARIFMGDTGSLFLGFILSTLPILTKEPLVWFPVAFLTLSTTLFDTGITLFRRILKKENLLVAHQAHFYQRLMHIGYSHKQITLLYTLLFTLSSLSAVAYHTNTQSFLVIGISVIVHCSLFITILWMEKQHKKSTGSVIPVP